MGWTNDQATNIDGQAFEYTNTTVLYSTGSALTIDSGAEFNVGTDIELTNANLVSRYTVPPGNTPPIRLLLDGVAVGTNRAINTAVVSEAFARWILNYDGRQEWGNGTDARDVSLDRTSSETLTLDGNLRITGELRVGGTRQGKGYVDSTSLDTSLPPIGNTPATAVFVSNVTWEAGRAYKVSFGTNVESSLAGALCRFQLHKTDESGTLMWDFGDWRTEGGNDMHVGGDGYIRRTAGTDLVATIALSIATITGGETTTHLGSAARPRFLLIEDIGSSSDYTMGFEIT